MPKGTQLANAGARMLSVPRQVLSATLEAARGFTPPSGGWQDMLKVPIARQKGLIREAGERAGLT